MDQQTKEQYIDKLKSSSWQDIKEEADKFGIEKDDEQKWKDLIPAIADKKFADPVFESSEVEPLTEEEKDFLEPELVKEDLPQFEEEEVLRFDYVRQGVTLNC